MTTERFYYSSRYLLPHMKEAGTLVLLPTSNAEMRGIRNLWALIGLTTFAQINNWFPSWVTPDCHRTRLNYGDTAVRYAHSEDNEWYPDPDDIPAVTELHEIDIHIDVHRVAIDAGSQLDGVYELGLGFLFFGPPAVWEDRSGMGNVYFWYRRLGDVPKKDW